MDYDGGGYEVEESRAYRSRLPAVIPPSRLPIAAPVWRRFALPHWRLIVVAALASVVGIASAALWPFQTKLGAVGHPARDRGAASHAAAPAAEDSAAHPPATIRSTAAPSTGIDNDVCRASFPVPQLAVSGPPTVLPAEAPASLGLAVDGAADGARVVICGFAAKSVFSAGRSIDEKTWTMPVSDVADATLLPPRGFVGPMKLVVALLNTDKSLVDRRTLHLQWLPQTPGVLAMPRIAEVNEQLEKGKRYKAAGDLAAARAIFLRLAQNGDSRAAFLLAETFDPIALAKLQLLPPDSDVEKARLWYRRASERGSPEANSRLERLSNW
jgi:hypothetical protein